jgi:hypothetical protein
MVALRAAWHVRRLQRKKRTKGLIVADTDRDAPGVVDAVLPDTCHQELSVRPGHEGNRTMSEQVMVKRVESFSGSVDELVDWCVQRGLDPSEVAIPSCHLRFEAAQTPAEAERRAQWEEAQRKRTEEWERRTYERLDAKFGGVR